METTVKQRLIQFIEYKKISIREFERVAKLSNGYIKGLRHSPSTDKMRNIIYAFPDLNQDWLLTGKGDMLSAENADKAPGGSPFFGDLPVSAGRVMQYPDILSHLPTGCIDIPQARGAEFFFPVIGMSMMPTIEEGEIIGVTHIDRFETTNADRIYMIVTRDNERMIKRILRFNKDAGTITIGSDNPKYPDSQLDISMILDVYKVVFHIKVETL